MKVVTGSVLGGVASIARSLGSIRQHKASLIQWAAVAGVVLFAISTPGFFSATSIRSLLTTVSFIGCVAVGMTFITLSGNIMSFSLGVTLSTCGIVFVAALPMGLVG